MSRELQREVLLRLDQTYPQWIEFAELGLDGSVRAVMQNLVYLAEHGLIECEPPWRDFTRRQQPATRVLRLKLLRLGAEFLATADLAVAGAANKFNKSRMTAARSL